MSRRESEMWKNTDIAKRAYVWTDNEVVLKVTLEYNKSDVLSKICVFFPTIAVDLSAV